MDSNNKLGSSAVLSPFMEAGSESAVSDGGGEFILKPTLRDGAGQAGIKMVRYRLAVGCKHQVTSEELKRVLIEESGADKNNIKIINIQGDYTIIELPDAMPQDIFLHLKSVEIKQHKLDIKRVKARNKRASNHRRRGRQRISPQSGNGGPAQVGES